MPVPWLVSSVPHCSDLSEPPQGREGDHVEQSDGTDHQESSPEINKQRGIVGKIQVLIDRLRGPHGELFAYKVVLRTCETKDLPSGMTNHIIRPR